MSREMPSTPARTLAVLTVALAAATGAILALAAPPAAEAAKPCWQRVMDDWLDNGRIDGVYSPRCIDEARRNLPEDIRAYSDIEDELDLAQQQVARTLQQSQGPSGEEPPPAQVSPSRTPSGESVPNSTGPRDEGPIQGLLAAGSPDEADSVPVPLIVLAALALLLMAAGAAGFLARKLQARRNVSR
jgi:hypothetical protein